MAKQRANRRTEPQIAPLASDQRLVHVAEDLGRIFGTVEARAKTWLGERQHVLGQLTALRSKIGDLIEQLGGGTQASTGGGRRGSRSQGAAAAGGRKRGRKKGSTMSAEARAKIAAAQRRRWAKVRKESA